jgi:CRP-like cAMP-binding protein
MAEAQRCLWQPQLEPVQLHVGEVLHEAGRVPSSIYFPTTAVASLLCLGESGEGDEIAVIGREGVVGMSLFIDGESTPAMAVVQSAGHAYRVPAWKINRASERAMQLMPLVLRFSLALTAQIAQISVCNRHHTVSQRLCRRLLQGLARQPGRELVITQEQLAGLLGVRRESVTAEAQKLQKAGCLHYARGHIVVTDPVALEQHACGCHAAVAREYHRLLPVQTRGTAPAVQARAYPHPWERAATRAESRLLATP